ncbi:Major facilitator superfamily domain-containing protein 6 [Holothuria leucospilota]|uniref:Major facilitator superfamily domain-containing protein 6 n=1 Tax=Holothuria leucospilota TaxID=206669 RepID=A0A9Q1BKS7_HOLLE|nr:Major facilitator superfamily domain-containing protein 6 [Holothuria leucospilota]
MAVCQVNKTFLPLKAGYLLYFAALACMFPYLPVYFVSLGIKVWQVGLLRGIDPILTFIFSPIWGGVADKFSKHRVALMAGIVGTTLSYFSFMFVPYITRPLTDNIVQDWKPFNLNETTIERFVCLNDSALEKYSAFKVVNNANPEGVCHDLCSNIHHPSHSSPDIFGLCIREDELFWRCSSCQSEGSDVHSNNKTFNIQRVMLISCDSEDGRFWKWPSSMVDSMTTGLGESSDHLDDCPSRQGCTCEIAREVPTARHAQVTFILCFILALLGNTFDCNILSYIDAAIMDLLGEKEKRYGKQRLWGAIGWGTVAFVGGMTVDLVTRASGSSEIRYEPLFVIFAIAMLLLLCSVLFVHFPEHHRPEHIGRDLLLLSIKPKVLLFILVVTVEGISLGMQYSFVNIYWQTELGASITLLGLSILLTTVAETPVLFFSGKIIQRIKYRGVVYSTLLAYAIRYICYAVIRNPWAVLPAQLLHGITFGIGWPGFTMYANQIAPPGMSATLQSIKLSAHFGGALACMFPYLPVYFVSLGIKVWQVGLLRGIDPILTFIVSPIWGGVADKFSKHRVALVTAIVGTTLSYFSFMLVPYVARPLTDNIVQDWKPFSLNEINFERFVCLNDSALETYPAFKVVNNANLEGVCHNVCSNIHHPSRNSLEIVGLCIREDEFFWRCSTCQSEGEDYHPNNKTITDNIHRVTMITCNSEDGSFGEWPSSRVDSMTPRNEEFSNILNGCSSKQGCTCEIAGDVPTARHAHVTFILCFILALLGNSFDCNILPYIDAAIMDLLGDKERHYGRQRLWGAIGWGTVAFVGGMTVDFVSRASGSPEIRYEPLFMIFAIAMLLLLCSALFVHFPEHRRPEHIGRDLLLLLIKPKVLLFIIVLTVEGISLGMHYSFVNVYWKTELGASITLIGLSILLTVIAETPFLYFSGKIIQRIKYQGVVYSTLLAYAIRYICYAIIRNPWAVLPVTLLHGITYGIGWPGFTMYANQIAPPGMSATLQSIKSSACFGGGFIIGNFAGGFIYDTFGPQTLFFGNAALCILTGVVFFIGDCILCNREGYTNTSHG